MEYDRTESVITHDTVTAQDSVTIRHTDEGFIVEHTVVTDEGFRTTVTERSTAVATIEEADAMVRQDFPGRPLYGRVEAVAANEAG